VPVEEIVGNVNRFLRGWAAYFRIGSSARHFDKITKYAVSRVAIFVAKLHRRSVRYGWFVIRQTNRLGLVDLSGTVVAPRPNYAWRALMAERRR
jgi:RNA-directed DNA polymerase